LNAAGQPADAAERTAALQADQSFIVQAPAGSGKTELLIQRYLRLLSVVAEPEQILAITFTRKAAAEMRERIVEALERARRGEVPTEPHLQLGYELAQAAMARDAERGWGLAGQPGRLRIGTIDAVNTWLAGRSPWSAGRQAMNRVSDDPMALYREAARETLALLGEGGEESDALRALLEHCDNRAERVIGLLTNLLSSRDQWLRHLGTGQLGDDQRASLEAVLAVFIESYLSPAAAALSESLKTALTPLLAFAATRLAEKDSDKDVLSWQDADHFPAPVSDELTRWRGLAQSLLTQSGEWRKKVTVREGFPAKTAEKDQFMQVLAELTEDAELAAILHRLQALPEAAYSEQQWRILKDVVRVLPVAAAMLYQVFSARGETDFSQIAADALGSLSSEDEISELSLTLDYSLQHILLDEFQDTSLSQMDLLRGLTAGWQPGDGRSLFLVGDPMQSIYRFREAEVGIFLGIQANGIPGLPLKSLRLKTNFRSDPAIVDWVNATFGTLLPRHDDPGTGAVSFAASESFSSRGEAGVQWQLFAHGDRQGEARAIAERVVTCSTQWPEATIGILVRSRAHAAGIGALLRAAGIGYSAPDLELLGEEPVAQDLLALTRALLHRADRIAWLALLRAPWCGLTLADLHALASPEPEGDIWELALSAADSTQLSDEGRQRLAALCGSLEPWLARRGACALRELVEGAWLALGGPACMAADTDFTVADEFFDYLDEVDVGGDCADVAELLSGIEKRPVIWPAARDTRVQLMTIHKAKGLEFDTVLLAGLGYSTRSSDKPLLLWHETSTRDGQSELLLAPLNARGDDKDKLFEMLWALDRERDAHEHQRLLYVAATRARQRLCLFAALAVPENDDEEPKAKAGSSLRALWPAVEATITQQLADEPLTRHEMPVGTNWWVSPLRRLPANWLSPLAGVNCEWQAATETAAEGEAPESAVARHVGTVVHRWLEEMALVGLDEFDTARITSLQPVFQRQLMALGTRADALVKAGARVAEALLNTLADQDGRWLLAGDHQQADAELCLSLETAAGDCKELRLDRSFIDADGQRWVVDYKTSQPGEEHVENFVQRECAHYREQLQSYRQALEALDDKPVRVALYFPLLGRLETVVLAQGSRASE
jgi:ATP-dependent exoDNAse (exonuclease V) beta subunit